MGSVGLLQWEAAFVCAALAPPTPTPMLQSRSPFFLIHPTPIILCPLIIHLRPLCSSPDILLQEGIDGLFLWSSQSCFGQADSPHACPPSTQTLGGGVSQGLWVPLQEGQVVV